MMSDKTPGQDTKKARVSELMKLAYQNIKGKKEKAEALRLAQIELKKNPQYEPPYYWAGFQHFGV